MKIVDYDIRQKNYYYMKRMRERVMGEDQHDTDCSWLERIWWGQQKKICINQTKGPTFGFN